jgi:CheY-like chemotaxis protein
MQPGEGALARSAEPEQHGGRGTLVIVDDSPSMRRSLEILIRVEGMFERIVTVEHALDALREVRRGGVDLVLCDYHLRGMDGLKLAQLLASMSVPLVLLTGYEAPSSATGVAEVLPKPVDAPVLMAALRRHRRNNHV